MIGLRSLRSASLLAALICVVCGFTSAPRAPLDVALVVTAAPAYEPLAALRGEERFPQGAHLLLVKDGHTAPLVPEFAASADARVSFDAQSILFTGKKSSTDPWSIWELTLAGHSLRQITTGSTDAIRPFYLPAGRLVYAQKTPWGFQLQTAQFDGTQPLTLSYIAASAIPTDVLADGRILFESGFPLGAGSAPELYTVYADGSGVESYRCDHAAAGPGRWAGHQLASGDIVFTHGSSLARFTSPLAAEAPIAAPRAQFSGAIAEMPSGQWLLSARIASSAHFALHLWRPGAPALQPLLAQPNQNLLDPVLVAPRQRPNRHPSGLHDWNYANLLALDARLSREGPLAAAPAQVRLESLSAAGAPGTLGTAPVEPDGSFFVKVPADTPIRFALLDARGAVLRQEHGWFWIRKGEQRICVGCHTGPERAADNRVPAVLLRTTEPVDLTRAATQAAHAATGSR